MREHASDARSRKVIHSAVLRALLIQIHKLNVDTYRYVSVAALTAVENLVVDRFARDLHQAICNFLVQFAGIFCTQICTRRHTSTFDER